MPQRGCPTCGITSKTAVLWPKTTPAQVPLAPAKTPLRRPEKATGRVAVTTPPWAAEHAKAIRTHAGGRLRALRVAASLRSGPLACLWRRGGHSQARERASCSSRAAHQPAEKTSIDLAIGGARRSIAAAACAGGWVTAAASRVTRRPTWRAGAVCRSRRVAAARAACRLPTRHVGFCSSCWWGTRADHVAAGGLPAVALRARQGRVRSDGGRPAAARRPPDTFGHLPCPRVASIRRGGGSASLGESLHRPPTSSATLLRALGAACTTPRRPDGGDGPR